MTVSAAELDRLFVSPTSRSVPKGTTLQYSATGIYTDNTTRDLTAEVLWRTSDPSVAHILNTAAGKGVLTASAPGTIEVSVSLAGRTARGTDRHRSAPGTDRSLL